MDETWHRCVRAMAYLFFFVLKCFLTICFEILVSLLDNDAHIIFVLIGDFFVSSSHSQQNNNKNSLKLILNRTRSGSLTPLWGRL